jgi:hypothetical protein
MTTPFLAVLWAAVAFVLYKITAYVLEELRHARNAKRLGCQNPPPVRTWDPFGVYTVYEVVRAFKRQSLPQTQQQILNGIAKREGWRVTTFHNVRTVYILRW